MSGGLDLDITLADGLSPTLRALKAAALDLSAPMAEASEAMLDGVLGRFADEESPLGIPWRKSAAAIEEGRKTLQESGDLRNAVDRLSGPEFAAVGVYQAGGPGIYARIHQFGGTIKPKTGKALNTPFGYRASVTVPARPYLGFSDEDVIAIDRILTRHLLAAMSKGAAA